MKQVYVPYWEWEDWLNGMWRKVDKAEESIFLQQAIQFTADHIKYGNAMKKVVYEWPRTMINSLTNVSINQRAFVGQCACCFDFNCPEYITRMAWKEITNDQRFLADKVAQETINTWKLFYAEQNKEVYKNMGATLLF